MEIRPENVNFAFGTDEYFPLSDDSSEAEKQVVFLCTQKPPSRSPTGRLPECLPASGEWTKRPYKLYSNEDKKNPTSTLQNK